MDNVTGAPEVKADLSTAFNEFMGAFEVFRETNDRRLAELEKKGVDPLTVEKLARVEAVMDANQRRMDELVLRSSRPSLMGGVPVVADERKSAFDSYVRSGSEEALRRLEKKALVTANASDTGLTVPAEFEAEVLRRLAALSPIRSIASVRQTSASAYRKPVTVTGVPAAWVGETQPREETEAALSELVFPTMELYAMPAATQTLLDDTAIDIDSWLASEVEAAFAEQETRAFVVGDGQTQPRGFTTYETVLESDWTWGKIGVVRTGVDGSFPSGSANDVLVDLVYALKAGYRQNAHFVMNRTTQAAVRKMKDTDGQYLWIPPQVPGTRASLMSFPVVEVEDMPSIAVGSNAIAFGDFNRGYVVVDRLGLRILRDPYSAKPYVLFYTTKRVGGGVQDFDAIKMLQFAA
ncbi:phage major capsid protein [Acuticoccus sp.]|uniref:phage major capsid protein n=1 Tax=Acuticoccus sp. TaxID=1904378 RepID=UPI003B5170D9